MDGLCREVQKFVSACEALHWMLGHPEESAAMGIAGRDYFARNYSWDVIMEKYERLLAMARRDRPAA